MSLVYSLQSLSCCREGFVPRDGAGGERGRSSCAQNHLAKNVVYKCLADALFDEALHFLELQC